MQSLVCLGQTPRFWWKTHFFQSFQSTRFNNCFLLLYGMFVYSTQAWYTWSASSSCFLVENQHHIEALNMYYSVSKARCIFAMSPSLQRNSWNAKEGKDSFRPCGGGLKYIQMALIVLVHLSTQIKIWKMCTHKKIWMYQSLRKHDFTHILFVHPN